MKVVIHTLILVLAYCFGPLSANATIKLAEESNEQITVNVSYQRAIESIRKINGTAYTQIVIPGTTQTATIGAPDVPTESRLIAVPAGKKPVLKITSLKSVERQLTDPIMFVSKIRRHCSGEREAAEPDQSLYASYHQHEAITLSQPTYVGPIRMSLLTIKPVLEFDTKKWTALSEAKLEITFIDDDSQAKAPIKAESLQPSQYNMFSRIALNRVKLPDREPITRNDQELVIVHQDMLDTLQPWISYRQANGRQLNIISVQNTDTSSVKQIISDAYAGANPPLHTTIVGSIDHVPSYRTGSFWSDYPYTLLDSGDYPDLSIGRFPARTVDELRNHINKIIARESSQRNNHQFLMTSGFETNWCQENLQFIMDNIYSGSESTIESTKRYASDGYRTDAVVAEYATNPNIIVYDGHGDPSGMTEIPLLVNHLEQLENSDYPLIMDIACNNSNWPSSGSSNSDRNFAESIIGQETNGAAGILASSYFSGGHDLFRHIFRAAIFDEENSNEPYHAINELGSMILYGKIKYLEQFAANRSSLNDNRMFYWLGDPATTFFE